ncbi:MAG: GFA family protein [Pseudomonadota bacterium]
MSERSRITVTGGCHCGDVRYHARLDVPVQAHACNCSVCQATGFVGVIIPAADFTLDTSREALSEYRFNTGVARHWFCARCGVKSFYRPRSNPDGISLNLHCLALAADTDVEIIEFDGRNWERNAASLVHLSRKRG